MSVGGSEAATNDCRNCSDYAGEEVAGQVQFGAEYYPDATRYGRFDEHPKAPDYLKRAQG
jgi:hypothetical protein